MFILRASRINAIRAFIRHQSTNESVSVQGWISKYHRTGAISFVHLSSDPTSETIQIVVPKQVCRNFSTGATAKVKGTWVESIGPGQDREILADEFIILHQNQIHSINGDFSHLRSRAHLRFKHPAVATVLKLRSDMNFYTHKFFKDKGYCHVDTPLISSNDCEGAGEAFTLFSKVEEEFFGPNSVYLPVSAQLHLEAVCSSLPNVYTLSATFRAEKSTTRSHMSEFRMLEAECAFMDSLDEICDIVEEYVKSMIKLARSKCLDNILRLQKILPTSENYMNTRIIETFDTERPFLRIHYNDAVKVIQSKGENVSNGFNKQQEQELVDYYGGPIFVQYFPASQKPFYMRFNDKGEAECFDLLFPSIGELAGGSVREYDFDSMKLRNLPSNLDWYLNLRQAGYPRSSGFGLGFDRFIQFLFSINNIKDTIPFPRWYKHCLC